MRAGRRPITNWGVTTTEQNTCQLGMSAARAAWPGGHLSVSAAQRSHPITYTICECYSARRSNVLCVNRNCNRNSKYSRNSKAYIVKIKRVHFLWSTVYIDILNRLSVNRECDRQTGRMAFCNKVIVRRALYSYIAPNNWKTVVGWLEVLNIFNNADYKRAENHRTPQRRCNHTRCWDFHHH